MFADPVTVNLFSGPVLKFFKRICFDTSQRKDMNCNQDNQPILERYYSRSKSVILIDLLVIDGGRRKLIIGVNDSKEGLDD